MNYFTMSAEERLRYGIDAQDIDDVWEQFDQWKRGTSPPEHDSIYDEYTERAALQEEQAAQERRDRYMECWIIDSEREAELSALRGGPGMEMSIAR